MGPDDDKAFGRQQAAEGAGGGSTATDAVATSAPHDDASAKDDHDFNGQSTYREQLEELLTLGRFDEVEALLERSDLSVQEQAVYQAAAATGRGEPVPPETRVLVEDAANADDLPEVTRKRAALVLSALPTVSPVSGNKLAPTTTKAVSGATTSR